MKQPPTIPTEESGRTPDPTGFLLRWRGQLQGPFSISEIEKRIAENQVGLAHEIQFENRWLPLRKFLEVQAARIEADRLQRATAEQNRREQEERETRGREERQNDALKQEEKRKIELLEAATNLNSAGSSGLLKDITIPNPKMVFGTIGCITLAIVILGYAYISQQREAERVRAESARIAAEKQAEAEKVKAAVSVVNTIIRGVAESSQQQPKK